VQRALPQPVDQLTGGTLTSGGLVRLKLLIGVLGRVSIPFSEPVDIQAKHCPFKQAKDGQTK
jgi:hypothetical protein